MRRTNNRITSVHQLTMMCFTWGSQFYSCDTLLILRDKSFSTWPSEPLLVEIHFQFEELVPPEHLLEPSAIPESTCAPAVQAPVYEDAAFDNRFLLDEPLTWEALLLSSQPQASQISPWGTWFPIWCRLWDLRMAEHYILGRFSNSVDKNIRLTISRTSSAPFTESWLTYWFISSYLNALNILVTKQMLEKCTPYLNL